MSLHDVKYQTLIQQSGLRNIAANLGHDVGLLGQAS